jgi:hypothetical protein
MVKNWIWFVALMALVLGIGLFLGKSQRADLGRSFEYSLDNYRKVDPELVKYKEADPIVPMISNLTAVAVAPENWIYEGSKLIAVAGEGCIQFLPDKVKLEVEGSPTCITVGEEGFLYVGFSDHIHVYDSKDDWSYNHWEVPSDKALLTSIAVDEWYVYAADAGSRRIWRYDRRNPDAAPLEIGEKDWANGVRGFNIPSPSFDIAISRVDGSLWAVNPGYHALENYRPDGMPLSSWEASSMRIEGFSGCCNPSHFALLPDGGFVTAEKGLPRVKIHNVDGSLRCVVAAPDQFDDDATGLDVAVDDEGRIYVLDPGRNQIRVFEEIK